MVTTQSRFLLRRLHLPGGQVFALTNRNAARHTHRPADTSFRREVERNARRELARQQPRLPMNQTNESSCQAGSHQGRTAMEHAMTCGYQRHVRARAAMRKPAWVGPLLTFMVRRGSPVRVRKRALQKPAQRAFFCSDRAAKSASCAMRPLQKPPHRRRQSTWLQSLSGTGERMRSPSCRHLRRKRRA